MAKKDKTVQDSNVVPFDVNAKPSAQAGYKVGDWVYYAFELQQIKKMDDKGNITEVSDGNVVISSREGQSLNTEVIALTPENKEASEVIKGVDDELNNYSATARLNTSEVYQWLVARWHDLVNAKDKAAQEVVATEINRLRQSIVAVINELHKVKFDITPAAPAKDGEVAKPSGQFQLFR